MFVPGVRFNNTANFILSFLQTSLLFNTFYKFDQAPLKSQHGNCWNISYSADGLPASQHCH